MRTAIQQIVLLALTMFSAIGLVGETCANDESSASVMAVATPSLAQAWKSAIGSDRTDQLTTLLDKHDPKVLLKLSAPNGKTALMVAAKKGDLALAKQLVSHGANVHEVTITNGNAFMFAVLGNQLDIVEWLYNSGAAIDTVGSNGWTALTIAAAKGNSKLLQWLLDRGANAQTRDVYRYTPLLRAVENGYIETAEILIDLPYTDLNAQDEYDNTALHHAVSSNNVEMIRLLIDNGANAEISNRQGRSAKELALGVSALEEALKR